MNIDGFKYFHAVAKLKSISKVANASHISQSALSQQLFKIEENLGVTAFKRSNKGVELTPEGEIILKYSDKIIKLYENLLSELEKNKLEKNNLIIETTCLSASYIFPKLLPKLSLVFNNFSYDIANKTKSNIYSDLINNICDISIGSIELDDPDLSSIHLGSDELILVSSSSSINNVNELPFLLLKDEVNIESYIKDLVDDNLSKLTFKYSGLVDSKIANNTQAVISVPEILVDKKYFFDGEKIILFGDSTKTIKFVDTTYNTVSGSSWPQVASKDINSTAITVPCVINEQFPVNINPKVLINRLFRDNNCTLELYYKNIDSITTDDDKIEQVNYLFDVYGLAVSRIIIINSLCHNSSLMSNDLWRKFFKIFSGYLRNYVDIEVTNLC